MVETYISLALKETIDIYERKELNDEELEKFVDFAIRKYMEED